MIICIIFVIIRHCFGREYHGTRRYHLSDECVNIEMRILHMRLNRSIVQDSLDLISVTDLGTFMNLRLPGKVKAISLRIFPISGFLRAHSYCMYPICLASDTLSSPSGYGGVQFNAPRFKLFVRGSGALVSFSTPFRLCKITSESWLLQRSFLNLSYSWENHEESRLPYSVAVKWTEQE